MPRERKLALTDAEWTWLKRDRKLEASATLPDGGLFSFTLDLSGKGELSDEVRARADAMLSAMLMLLEAAKVDEVKVTSTCTAP